ncbi:hypothetical protein PENTCL1PPCAC_19296, partial [Pristionchus entomophagus]
ADSSTRMDIEKILCVLEQMGSRAKRIEAFHELREWIDETLEDTVENHTYDERILKMCLRAIKIHYDVLSLIVSCISNVVHAPTLGVVESDEVLLPFIFDELRAAQEMGEDSDEGEDLHLELSDLLDQLYLYTCPSYRTMLVVRYHTQITGALLAMRPEKLASFVEYPAFYAIIASTQSILHAIGTSVQPAIPGLYRCVDPESIEVVMRVLQTALDGDHSSHLEAMLSYDFLTVAGALKSSGLDRDAYIFERLLRKFPVMRQGFIDLTEGGTGPVSIIGRGFIKKPLPAAEYVFIDEDTEF